MRPDFIIAGAPKAGTTALYHALRSHPEVFLPDVKEPGYFLAEERIRTTRTRSEYDRLFASVPSGVKAVGEASVNYLYDEGAAARIRDELGGDVRILLMLRDPATAAFSLWRHNVRTAGEELSFGGALEAEKPRRNGEAAVPRGGLPARYYAYTERVRYAAPVRRFVDTFGRDRVRVDIYEEFFRDPPAAFAEICRFLGVDDSFVPAFRVANPSGDPRSRLLRDVANRRAWWKAPLKWILPPRARDRIRHHLNEWNSSARGKTAPAVRAGEEAAARVRAATADDVRELEALLDRALPWGPAARD